MEHPNIVPEVKPMPDKPEIKQVPPEQPAIEPRPEITPERGPEVPGQPVEMPPRKEG